MDSPRQNFTHLDNYRPQQSWGKVIFSEACVKNCVPAWQGGCAWQRGMHGGEGGVAGRVCMAGGEHGRG